MKFGEFELREAVAADIVPLARLHVTTWNATYPDEKHKPTFETRHYQWTEAFASVDGSWFCYVVENAKGELVGFAKGKRDKNGFGNLNKIYLLDEYEGRGLGRLMVMQVAKRFLEMGITGMSVVADVQNPTCGFYERLGGRKIAGKDPAVAVYVWRDLKTLTADSPTPL